jgi:hypothetical protein
MGVQSGRRLPARVHAQTRHKEPSRKLEGAEMGRVERSDGGRAACRQREWAEAEASVWASRLARGQGANSLLSLGRNRLGARVARTGDLADIMTVPGPTFPHVRRLKDLSLLSPAHQACDVGRSTSGLSPCF